MEDREYWLTWCQIQTQVQKANGEISVLRSNLKNTDYKSIQHSEGVLSDEDFAPIFAQRQEWRARINELEEEVETFSSQIKALEDARKAEEEARRKDERREYESIKQERIALRKQINELDAELKALEEKQQ